MSVTVDPCSVWCESVWEEEGDVCAATTKLLQIDEFNFHAKNIEARWSEGNATLSYKGHRQDAQLMMIYLGTV